AGACEEIQHTRAFKIEPLEIRMGKNIEQRLARAVACRPHDIALGRFNDAASKGSADDPHAVFLCVLVSAFQNGRGPVRPLRLSWCRASTFPWAALRRPSAFPCWGGPAAFRLPLLPWSSPYRLSALRWQAVQTGMRPVSHVGCWCAPLFRLLLFVCLAALPSAHPCSFPVVRSGRHV